MIRLYFYQAECGDAFRIEFFGDDKKVHNVFIDSGFVRTYRSILHNDIDSLATIDLWLITHLHDDHIGGVTRYIDDVNRAVITDKVTNWIYNNPRQVVDYSSRDISTAASINQSDLLSAFIELKNANRPDIVNDIKPFDIYGLTLTILSPDRPALERLRKKYIVPGVMIEREEDTEVSRAMAASGNDYHILLKDFLIDDFIQDSNIENGSSIAVHLVLGKLSVLYLSDSHPSIVVQSLKDMGYSKSNPLHCDYVQVAHHGSKFNNSPELFEIIDCHHYIFSANGANKFFLPSKQTMAVMLRHPGRLINDHKLKLYFTYDNEILRDIFAVDGPTIFDELNFELIYNSNPAIVIPFDY